MGGGEGLVKPGGLGVVSHMPHNLFRMKKTLKQIKTASHVHLYIHCTYTHLHVHIIALHAHVHVHVCTVMII